MARPKCTAVDFAAAVRDSFSIAGVLRRLSLRGAGGNYATVKRLVKKWQLDVSHWTGQGHRKGSNVPVARPRPLDVVLIRNLPVNSHSLRRSQDAAGGELGYHCPTARVMELVDIRDLSNLSPSGETPEVTLVKVGESPGVTSEPMPSQASERRKV